MVHVPAGERWSMFRQVRDGPRSGRPRTMVISDAISKSRVRKCSSFSLHCAAENKFANACTYC